MAYSAIANVTVAVHVSFVVFVILGGPLVQRWHVVAFFHVPAVVYAILIQTAGFSCFLTGIEKSLRRLSGQEPYTGDFLHHYIWSRFGLSGTEPAITIVVLGLIALLSFRPYLAWATA